jgi:hypothetical protein
MFISSVHGTAFPGCSINIAGNRAQWPVAFILIHKANPENEVPWGVELG